MTWAWGMCVCVCVCVYIMSYSLDIRKVTWWMCCLSGRKSQRLQQHPCSPWDTLCSSPYKTLLYLVLLEPSEDDSNNSDLKVLLLGLRRWILRNAIPPRGCCCLVAESCLTLVRWWTAAHQALLSTGFPRQEY